jgi:integrase
VSETGAGKWVFRFSLKRRVTEMGLGSADAVPLADARSRADEARKCVARGQNPIEVRREAARAAAGKPTFGEFADELVKDLAHGFHNEKHKAQWAMTLTHYAAPLRPKRLDEIATDDVLAVLRPLWQTRHETASRLRGRIEHVLDAAKAKGLRTAENPARWRGHLKALLPKRQKLTRGHHRAMAYGDVPAFITRLRASGSVSALALEFLILTAARAGEVLGARWDEIDTAAKLWTLPARRMKGHREHRIPLCERAVEIVGTLAKVRQGELVFPGNRPGRPLSLTALHRTKASEFTVHGFRSAFRDWCGEATAFPRDVAEAALAHAIGDETERAYRRGDALEKRRKLMDAWASYLDRPPAADNLHQFVKAKA